MHALCELLDHLLVERRKVVGLRARVIGAIGQATNDSGSAPRSRAKFEQVGFTHICLRDVSEDQAGFIEFAKQFLAA